ncbi:TPA: hypothetical protein ACKRFF_001342 [Providencia stuartii]|uniref:hypothetical protein n=1 Tax=Providencia stuartii TaxID=588 RepID=UPI00197E378A|nr:hypothetical protein [Providencia stuartii]MBN5557386.1 hypothetical protein [Providencia stuartii]HEM8264930.1 hypothetical protein [Providencia stuartii]HEM8266931.1 hypothetical protein [Providencia stuartii]HEM8284931.1 hypothetical protein [Providencia stuartii]HEM8286897.1 hypothetical protein [Providencia stuartii]
MTPEQKREIEMLLEAPENQTATLLTLLATWCEAERDNETRNMISIAITIACQIKKSLEKVTEGK